MPARVTQTMLNTQLLRNLSGNLGRMERIQNQLATGRRINQPSDDPVGMTYALRYRSELSANEQYLRNVDAAVSWLEFTDSVLNQAGNILQRVRELAVQGANGTNPDSAMQAIRAEVEQLRRQMLDVANSTLNGKYIFNGQQTDRPPYPDPTTAAGQATDGFQIRYEVGPGIELPVNVTGNEIFGVPGDADNLFKVLDDLVTALGNIDYAGVNQAIGLLDSRMDKMLSARAEIGARSNRVELMQARLQELGANLTALQSKTEDADIARLITDLKTAESVYQASLATGARLIRPSLIDFLR